MQNKLDPRTIRFRNEYQDKHFFTKDGKLEFKIIDARTYGDVDIQYIESGIIKNTKVGNIKNGLPNPFAGIAGCRNGDCPIAFESPQYQYTGCVYITNQGYHILITRYDSYTDVYYKFLDGPHEYEGKTTIQNIKKGQVLNPYHPNIFGGYIGPDKTYRNDSYDWLSNIWFLILSRLPRSIALFPERHTDSKIEAYSNTIIDRSWLCYGNFADWYMSIFKDLNPNYVYNIDKDLLFPYYAQYTDGQKCYSAMTCTIIPQFINIAISSFNFENPDPGLFAEFEDKCKVAWREGAIDDDTYFILRRTIFNDPEYKNYVTIKMPCISQININNFTDGGN